VNINWQHYREQETRLRVELPTYPFEHVVLGSGVRFETRSHQPSALSQKIGLSQEQCSNQDAENADALNKNASNQSESKHDLAHKANRHPRPNLVTAFVAPRNDIEAHIAELWCELFKLEQIGIHDDFFELGGNSLLATRLLSKLRENGFDSLSLSSLFDHKTVAELVRNLGKSATKSTVNSINEQSLVLTSGAGEALEALTPMQQKLWMFSQFGDGHMAYHMPLIIDAKGDFNQAAFKAALEHIIERHQVLRTTYHNQDGGVCLQVRDDWVLPYRVEVASEQNLMATIQQDIARAFDLENDCLLRASEYILADSHRILLITQHHIASDGWSVSLLAKELEVLYGAFVNNQTPVLPPLALQFQDYAHAYQHFMQGPVFAQQLQEWKHFLHGAPHLHDLPLDHPRDNQQHFAAQRLIQCLPTSLTQPIRDFNLAHNLTPFMLLQSTLALVLCRWSNTQDIVMGTPIAGRSDAKLEPLIGAFVNTLVLRNQVEPTQSFVAYLQTCRQHHLDGFSRQMVPYEMLLDELGVVKTRQYNPLYQILFAMQNNERPAIHLPDLQLNLLEPQHIESVFDLQINAYEVGDEIQLVWDFNTALFEASSIERMMASFERVLAFGLQQPNTPVGQIPLLGESLASLYAQTYNATALDAEPNKQQAPLKTMREQTLIARIMQQMQDEPERMALEAVDQRLHYRDLQQQVCQLSAALQAKGIGNGHFVALYLPRQSHMLIALLAAMHCGATFVPLDPKQPLERCQSVLSQVPVSAVLSVNALCTDALLDVLATLSAESTPELLVIDKLANAEAQVCLDLGVEPEKHDSTAISRNMSINSENPAYILFTSGSTGQPKGVMVSPTALSEILSSFIQQFGITSNCRWLAVSTFTFDIALLEMLAPLCVGGCVVIATEDEVKDGFALQQKLENSQINTLQATPATYKMLLLANWQGMPDLKALSGGEALTTSLVEGMQGKCAEFWNGYGPTEATIYCLLKAVDFNADSGETLSLGGPLANTGYLVLDEQYQAVPVGVSGQLFIGGVGLAQGYWQQNDLTESRFVELDLGSESGNERANLHRFYASGDLVRVRKDGNLDYLGRLDHQVKVRGHRIELGEIEAQVAAHPAVKDASVLVLTHSDGEAYIVCYLLTQQQNRVIDEIRQHLFQQLPAYMLPSAYVPLPSWPLTANGKIDRNALPVPDFNQVAVPMIKPENATQQAVADLCQKVLHLEQLSLAANFFELGGNSLTATHFVALLNEQFTLQLSVKDVVEQATLLQVANLLEAKRSDAQRAQHLLMSDETPINDDTLEEFEL
ncbi:non-ribosomal peptide synthetase, partial [Alteromonas sp. a30]|uniref:non-ribosomal peptide synthetase n=1 Tax=Alteromonas sp. a30 TaxID=2730917 RepID=UPI0022803F0B